MNGLIISFGIPLTLNRPLSIKGSIDDKNKKISNRKYASDFTYNGTHYRDGLSVGNPEDTLKCDVSLIKYNANRYYKMPVNAKAINNRLSTIFEWNNHQKNLFSGKIATETRFYKNDENKDTASINVLHHTISSMTRHGVWSRQILFFMPTICL